MNKEEAPAGEFSDSPGLQVYVDGAGGKKNPVKHEPRSGWGMSVWWNGSEIYEACGVISPQVTSPAAELEAYTQALAYLHNKPPALRPVTIWVDSRYVTDCLNEMATLAARDFRLANGEEMANRYRIMVIKDLLYEMGLYQWVITRRVKGHKGIPGNERADMLSQLAAKKGESFSRAIG